MYWRLFPPGSGGTTGRARKGTSNPKDITPKAGEAAATLQPEGLPGEGKVFSEGSWHRAWAATRKGNARSWHRVDAGIQWLYEGPVGALDDFARSWLLQPAEMVPAAQAQARAAFLPKSCSTDIVAYGPPVPSEVGRCGAQVWRLWGHTDGLVLVAT